MAQRLPNVGSDDGTWGTILNNYLLVAHNADGTLQGIGQANGIAPLDSSAKVPVANLPSSTTPDATTTSKGIVQLAGDLAGTAASPTVPGLASKELLANKDTDATLAANSDTRYPSQKAVKTYVTNQIPGQILATAKLVTALTNGCEPQNMAVSPETTDVAFTVPASGDVDIDVSLSAAVYGVSHVSLALIIGPSSMGSLIPKNVGVVLANTTMYDLGRLVGGGIGQNGGVVTKNLHITGLTPGASMKFTLIYAITGYMNQTPTANSSSIITDICLNTDQSLAICSDTLGQNVAILARGRLPELPYNQWMTRIFVFTYGYPNQVALHPSVKDMIAVACSGTSTSVCTVDPYLGKVTPYLSAPSGGETTFTAVGFINGGGGYAATTPASGTKPSLYSFSGAAPNGVWGTRYTLPSNQPASANFTRMQCGSDGNVYIASGTTLTMFKPSTSTFVQISPAMGNVNDVAVASDASFLMIACANGIARYNLPLAAGATPVYTAGTSRGNFCRIDIGPNNTGYWSSLNGTTSNTQGFMYGYTDDGTVFDSGIGYVCTALAITNYFDILSTYGGQGSVTGGMTAGNVNEWFGGSLQIQSDSFWCQYAEITVRSAK